MTSIDVLGILVFSILALGLVVIRLWGAMALHELDGVLLVLSVAAVWFSFAVLLIDDGHDRWRAPTPR